MKGVLLICVLLCFGRVLLKGWDGYIDNLVGNSRDTSGFEHVDKSCIIGLDGGAKRTTDSNQKALKLSLNEASTFANVFKRDDFTQFMVNGIYAEGVKYQFLREEDRKIVFLRKKRKNGALTLRSSKTDIVIAHTKEGGQQGIANKAVSVIGEYLAALDM